MAAVRRTRPLEVRMADLRQKMERVEAQMKIRELKAKLARPSRRGRRL